MKNVILCFDGTNNEPEDADQKKEWLGVGELEDTSVTNILKLHLLFGGDLQGNNSILDQVSFYYPGVGTYGSMLDKLRNMALAPPDEDVGNIIKKAVKDLYKYFDDDDQLYIFGFSRGAAIARRFSTVLKDTFPALGRDVPKIKFLGVFDTVAAIKHPNLFKEEIKPASDVVFENRTISPLIEKALHLLSLDDRRIAFFPVLMNEQDEVEEVWFSGAHSDVGGGYRHDGLSDLSLQFMLDYIDDNQLGLKLMTPLDINYMDLFDGPDEYIQHEDIIIQPNYMGENHQQAAKTKIKESLLDYRAPRISINDIPSVSKAVVHHSVFKRIQDDSEYQCFPLKNNMGNPYTGEDVGICVWHDSNTITEHASLTDAMSSVSHKPTRLELEKKAFDVHSNQKYNSSNLLVKEGDLLVFTVDMSQKWFDASIECGPDGWLAEKEMGYATRWMVKFKEDDRRHKDAQWFEVIACVNRSDDELIRILEHNSLDNAYEVKQAGVLYAFANDLVSKYGNNRGSIRVTVERVEKLD